MAKQGQTGSNVALRGKIGSNGELRGILSPGANYLRGLLSPGQIVLNAYCLGVDCLLGGLSPGQIISSADCLWGWLSPEHVVGRGTLSRGTMSLHCSWVGPSVFHKHALPSSASACFYIIFMKMWLLKHFSNWILHGKSNMIHLINITQEQPSIEKCRWLSSNRVQSHHSSEANKYRIDARAVVVNARARFISSARAYGSCARIYAPIFLTFFW